MARVEVARMVLAPDVKARLTGSQTHLTRATPWGGSMARNVSTIVSSVGILRKPESTDVQWRVKTEG